MNVTHRVWRTSDDDDVHVTDQRITPSLIRMSIRAYQKSDIHILYYIEGCGVTSLITPPSAIFSPKTWKLVSGNPDRNINQTFLFCFRTPQTLTLAPPSAAVTELQVISHASLLWAWELSLTQWTKLELRRAALICYILSGRFCMAVLPAICLRKQPCGWTELRRYGWEISQEEWEGQPIKKANNDRHLTYRHLIAHSSSMSPYSRGHKGNWFHFVERKNRLISVLLLGRASPKCT